tara:strand:- start:1365 stop:2594 length:1230 start_codon:yes stop_codon:yes gene_type:complete
MSPPLPNANKKSPRVYRNLQTKDLENVTFSDMEATGDPLSIELHNEDELRRLVLVQLARLTCKSEWTGLLTGATGMTSFTVEADTGTPETITNGASLKFSGGTGLDTVVSAPDTITTSISNTGVLANSYASPSSVTVNAQGQITAITAGTSPTTYTLDATQSGSDVELNLDASAGADSTVKLVAGSNITLTRTASDSVTLASSGGSSTNSYDVQLPSGTINAGSDSTILHSRMPPWGSATSSASALNSDANPKFWPFVCAKTGDLDKIVIDVTADGTGVLILAIYSDTGTCLPDSKIGGDFSYTFGTSGTGCVDLGAPSQVALTRGTQYWIGVVEQSIGNGAIRCESGSAGFSFGPISDTASSYASTSSSTVRCLELSSSSNVLPSSVTASNLTNKTAFGMPRWGAKFS